MHTRIAKVIGALALTASVSACAIGPEAGRQIKANTDSSSAMMSSAAAPLAPKDTRPVKINNGVFVGSKSIRNDNGDPLPSRFEGPSGITIVKTTPIGLREIAAAVTEYTKIPVVVAAATPIGKAAGGQQPQQSADFAPGEMPPGFPINEALAQLNAQTAAPITASGISVSAEAIPLNYAGSLSGLLDIVTAHFNVAWKYEKGRIVLESVVTRSFDIPALAVVSEMEFDLSSRAESSGGQSGTSASSGQMAASRSETNVFQEVDEGLKGLVGEGSYSINKSTGTVTVTGSPATITRVADYLSSVNQRLGEQIAVSVKVYSVTLNDNEEFDLNIAGVLNKAGQYGLTAGNMAASGGVVPSTNGVGPGLGWALLNPKHEAYGSQALVNALSTRGDVSVVTTASVTTLNGVPVPLQVGEVRDYVKNVTVTPGEEGAAPTASLESATVSTGFSLQLTPRVERNSDVLLQYGINISELTGANDGFDTFETLGSTVQLRRLNQRNFIQQARIPNGATLVLAGFEQVRNESVKRGAGWSGFPLLGGGNRAAMKREIIVIAITPTLLRTN